MADMGPRPSLGHSVERRDRDGHYTPDNCYWATAEQQAQNKRNTVTVEFNGELMSLRKACRLVVGGWNRQTVNMYANALRYKERGYAPLEALKIAMEM
jgi:hypothetical protein